MTNQAMPSTAGHVRFSNRNQKEFTKTLRKRVDNYFKENGISRQGNATMYIKTLILFSAYLLPFVALLFVDMTFGVSLLLWTVMGFAVAGIGMAVMHDANHGSYSRNNLVNIILGHSLNLCGGAVINWKIQHNVLHHTYTNIAGKDGDIDGAGTLRFHPHGEAKKHHRFQFIYAFGLYSILTLFWVVGKDFIQYNKFKGTRKNTNLSGSDRFLLARIFSIKVVYLGVFFILPIVLGGFAFWQVLVGFMIMHIIGGLILSFVFQMAHVVEDTEYPLPDEAGNMEDSFMAHQLRTTCNFSTHHKWLTWYSGGLNHQVEHHLFPNICHVHYSALAPIVKETAKEFGLPYLEHRKFSTAYSSHIRMLKKFGLPSLTEIGA